VDGGRTFETHIIRSTHKSQPKNSTMTESALNWSASDCYTYSSGCKTDRPTFAQNYTLLF